MPLLFSDSVPGRRVLIVEGSAACRRHIRDQLASEHFELDEASSGHEALMRACAFRPDLVLLDLALPDRDGFETLRRLKDDPLTRPIPVVLLSDRAAARDKARGLDLGAVDFLTKPTDPIELRARVRAAVRTKYLLDLLQERAHLDGLTGLGNRFALQERIEATWQLCRRRGTPMAVILADLDHFKHINDEHGHATGDEILRRTALVLRAAVRSCDFVARYGGEEFMVVAPDCDLEGGIMLAERFRAELSGPRGAAHRLIPGPVTTSMGVADTDHPGCSTPGSLIGRADRALYRAKAAGRDAVWFWDGTHERPSPTSPAKLVAVPAGLA